MSAALRIGAWAAGLLALAVASQLALPGYVEQRIEAGLQSAFDRVDFVRADVRAYPALALLGGRIHAISLDLRRVSVGGLTVDAVLLDGRNVVVDLPKLLTGRGVEVSSADSLRATFVISEDDLNEYFWSQIHTSRFFRVDLERGRAVLYGSFNILGREVGVTVSGRFQVTGGTKVSFVPEEVTVENTAVPKMFLDMIAQEWAITLDLHQAALPLAIEDLFVEEGQLLIYGKRPIM